MRAVLLSHEPDRPLRIPNVSCYVPVLQQVWLTSPCSLQALSDSIPASRFSHPSNSFAERFKYDVISSSLLSNSLAATPQPGRRAFAPGFASPSDTSSGEHSRSSSTSVEPNSDIFVQKKSPLNFEPGDVRVIVAIISAAVLAFAAGYELLAMLLLALSLYTACASMPVTEGVNNTALVSHLECIVSRR